MGQKMLQSQGLSEVTKGSAKRAAEAEAALNRIAAREAILGPHLDILSALCQNAGSEQEQITLRFCSYLLQNSSLEKLESVEMVANWYRGRDRFETTLSATA